MKQFDSAVLEAEAEFDRLVKLVVVATKTYQKELLQHIENHKDILNQVRRIQVLVVLAFICTQNSKNFHKAAVNLRIAIKNDRETTSQLIESYPTLEEIYIKTLAFIANETFLKQVNDATTMFAFWSPNTVSEPDYLMDADKCVIFDKANAERRFNRSADAYTYYENCHNALVRFKKKNAIFGIAATNHRLGFVYAEHFAPNTWEQKHVDICQRYLDKALEHYGQAQQFYNKSLEEMKNPEEKSALELQKQIDCKKHLLSLSRAIAETNHWQARCIIYQLDNKEISSEEESTQRTLALKYFTRSFESYKTYIDMVNEWPAQTMLKTSETKELCGNESARVSLIMQQLQSEILTFTQTLAEETMRHSYNFR